MRWILVVCFWTSPAWAHIEMLSPTPRTTAQKKGPCGQATSERGDNVIYYKPGDTVTFTWEDTFNHPSHYRISLDMDGEDDFANPPQIDCKADEDENDPCCMPGDLGLCYYTNSAVLVDNLPDTLGDEFHEYTITLPDQECDNCTLQLVQVMKDTYKAPYDPSYDSNDLYYQCADIVITNNPPPPGAMTPDPMPPTYEEPGCTGNTTSHLWIGVILVFCLVWRKPCPA